MTPSVITDGDVLAAAAAHGWTLEGVGVLDGLHRLWAGNVGGARTAFFILDPNRVTDPALRQVVLMRHLAMFTGECPACGAVLRAPNRAERRRLRRSHQVGRIELQHEHDCPVSDDAVRETAAATRN